MKTHLWCLSQTDWMQLATWPHSVPNRGQIVSISKAMRLKVNCRWLKQFWPCCRLPTSVFSSVIAALHKSKGWNHLDVSKNTVLIVLKETVSMFRGKGSGGGWASLTGLTIHTMMYERPAIQMVAVKKETMNHLSQRRLPQLGTVKKRSRDNGHMISHLSLLHTPAGMNKM